MQRGQSSIWVCDFSSQDILPHEAFSLHPEPNHNPKPNPKPNPNPNPKPNTNPDPNPNSAVAETCLKIKKREMNCLEMNCPIPDNFPHFRHFSVLMRTAIFVILSI